SASAGSPGVHRSRSTRTGGRLRSIRSEPAPYNADCRSSSAAAPTPPVGSRAGTATASTPPGLSSLARPSRVVRAASALPVSGSASTTTSAGSTSVTEPTTRTRLATQSPRAVSWADTASGCGETTVSVSSGSSASTAAVRTASPASAPTTRPAVGPGWRAISITRVRAAGPPRTGSFMRTGYDQWRPRRALHARVVLLGWVRWFVGAALPGAAAGDQRVRQAEDPHQDQTDRHQQGDGGDVQVHELGEQPQPRRAEGEYAEDQRDQVGAVRLHRFTLASPNWTSRSSRSLPPAGSPLPGSWNTSRVRPSLDSPNTWTPAKLFVTVTVTAGSSGTRTVISPKLTRTLMSISEPAGSIWRRYSTPDPNATEYSSSSSVWSAGTQMKSPATWRGGSQVSAACATGRASASTAPSAISTWARPHQAPT